MTTNNIHPTGLNCDVLVIPVNDKTIGIPDSDLHIYVNSYNKGSAGEIYTAINCITSHATNPLPGVRFALLTHNSYKMTTVPINNRLKARNL